jgi:hypothetical protein
MNIHFLLKDYSWNVSIRPYANLSLIYDLQNYFKIVSKISYTGPYNQIGKIVSILSHKS